jgi:hypothetical protein
MKKTLTIILFVLFAAPAFAQQVNLNLYGSYMFDDHINSYYNTTSYFNGTVKGGGLYGGGVEVTFRHSESLELSYFHQSTSVQSTYYDRGEQLTDFGLSSNYIMFGGNQYFGNSSKLDGFVGGMLGAAILDVKNPNTGNSGSTTEFAWGFRGGANYWFSNAVGLKLQLMLLSSVHSVGGGVYYGTYGAYAVSTASSILQFGIGGGLVFRLNANK